jgi:GntR family transcriptional regulator
MISVDYRDSRPIYEQVCDAYRRQILAGILEPDSEMPSVRNLAVQLSVNPNTIQRAYRELETQGFIYSVKGKGSFVSNSSETTRIHKEELLASFDEIAKELLDLGEASESLIDRINEIHNNGGGKK